MIFWQKWIVLGNYEPQIFVNTLQFYFQNITQKSFCEQAIHIREPLKISSFLCGPPIGFYWARKSTNRKSRIPTMMKYGELPNNLVGNFNKYSFSHTFSPEQLNNLENG
jgi:hypothetical protein